VDGIILIIIAACVIAGYAKGLIRTLYRLVSFFAAIFLASRLYPYVSRLLMQTNLYDTLQNAVIDAMGLQPFVHEHVSGQAEQLIATLPLPEMIKNLLNTYNTPEMFEFLNVRTMEEYIGGFFANIMINIISMILVFFVVTILLSIVGSLLDIVGRLPVINTLNRLGGLAAGLVMGVIFVWAGLALVNLLFATPAYPAIYEGVQGSRVAHWFFENNWMILFVA
jgi:uncharacterized membrane protein required for colicin V production